MRTKGRRDERDTVHSTDTRPDRWVSRKMHSRRYCRDTKNNGPPRRTKERRVEERRWAECNELLLRAEAIVRVSPRLRRLSLCLGLGFGVSGWRCRGHFSLAELFGRAKRAGTPVGKAHCFVLRASAAPVCRYELVADTHLAIVRHLNDSIFHSP